MARSNVKEKESKSEPKIYVNVVAAFSSDGRIRPMCIVWEDGRKFPIDKVIDIRRAASLKAGGTGLRFTCQIGGGQHYLFYEDNYKWFVEGK